jgi:agmatine deiminase
MARRSTSSHPECYSATFMDPVRPSSFGFRMPAEWHPHRACWLAYPHLRAEWGGRFEAARAEWLGLARAIAVDAGESLEVLAPDEPTARSLEAQLGEVPRVRVHVMPYGDAWTRDTAPCFVLGPGDTLGAVCFRFDGWGRKYEMPGDEGVASDIATSLGCRSFGVDLVAEGGALEVDGEGTVLTTRACLVDEHRNPGRSRDAIEAVLESALGVSKVIWLEATLANDHTDGHIDTLARFVRPGEVLCMAPSGEDDPNAEALESLAAQLARAVDARGRRLTVHRIPSPGRVTSDTGEILAASYCNYYLGNDAVLVPLYESPWDGPALEALASLFPGRRVLGLPARAILSGGGAFHCITQQEPEAR